MLKLDIQLFGGKGASSSNTKKESKTYSSQEIKEKQKELDRAIENGSYLTIERKRKELEQMKANYNPKEYVPTFTGSKNLDKALDNGYIFYRRDDLSSGGRNYKEIANRLKAEGYKVRVFEDATRVRGLHNYSVLYKRGK